MTAEVMQLCAGIEALLTAERQAIRHGDLRSLGALAAEKSRLIGRLGSNPDRALAARLSHLKERAEANQTLLSAAIDGVKAARARLTAIRSVASRLDTYDSAGRAKSVSFGPGTVERRA